MRRIASSPEGRAGVASVRQMLAGRPRDETISVKERREALEAFAARSPSLPIAPLVIGGVHVERHDPAGARATGALVYAHGGAFVLGSAATHRGLAAAIAEAAGLPLYAVDYRLAPEAPFPAGRDDIVAVCEALSASGVGPVALVGDSAGGNLCHVAAIALRDRGAALPCAIAITSPWVDLECKGESHVTKRDVEIMLSREGLMLDAGRYLGNHANPAASPLSANLTGLPPVYIQVGADEILLDDSLRLADRLRGSGVDVDLEVWDDMVHSWHAFRGLVPEAERATQSLGAFLRAAVTDADKGV